MAILEMFKWIAVLLIFGWGSAATAGATPPSGAQELVERAQATHASGRFHEALKQYKLAAERGEVTAMFQLGAMHERGEGVPANFATAAGWYQRSADGGSVSAMKRLANMYLDGQGVAKDFKAAAKLYQRAGAFGDANSLFLLGQLYWKGEYAERQPDLAMKTFEQCARVAHASCMNALGIGYRLGDGVEKNDALAYAYFKLAVEFGDRMAADNLQQLSSRLSANDRAFGEELTNSTRKLIRRP